MCSYFIVGRYLRLVPLVERVNQLKRGRSRPPQLTQQPYTPSTTVTTNSGKEGLRSGTTSTNRPTLSISLSVSNKQNITGQISLFPDNNSKTASHASPDLYQLSHSIHIPMMARYDVAIPTFQHLVIVVYTPWKHQTTL